MTELLKQGQYTPMSAADQVVSLYAASEGYLDGVELRDVARFEQGLLPYVRSRFPELEGAVLSGSKLTKEQLALLREIIGAYTADFR